MFGYENWQDKFAYGNLNVYICIMALNYVHFEIVSLQSADNESKWKMVIRVFLIIMMGKVIESSLLTLATDIIIF